MRPFVAVLIGIIVAFTLVSLGDIISHQIVPAPSNLDVHDKVALAAYAKRLPVSVFGVLYAAMVVGSFCGGFLACLIARKRYVLNAWIIGCVVLLGALGNFAMIPHPLGFVILSLASLLAVPFLVARIFKGKAEPTSPA